MTSVLALSILVNAAQATVITVTHRARAVQPGELVVLTITSSTPLTNVEVKAFDRTQRVASNRAQTWISYVGIDLDVKPGNHLVTVTGIGNGGATKATYALSVVRKAFATRTLSVDPNFVNPPASEAARIERDSAALAIAFEGNAGPELTSPLTFIRPVPHAANSAFGTRSIFNGEARNSHSGADFLSPTGTPIKSPAPGTVTLAEDLYYSGGAVVVDHGMGIISLFAHMSSVIARKGDDVKQGDVVGLVGATGRVTGPHLHWTVRVNGARVDPLSLLALLPVPKD